MGLLWRAAGTVHVYIKILELGGAVSSPCIAFLYHKGTRRKGLGSVGLGREPALGLKPGTVRLSASQSTKSEEETSLQEK